MKTVNSVTFLSFRWHIFEHGAATYVPTWQLYDNGNKTQKVHFYFVRRGFSQL